MMDKKLMAILATNGPMTEETFKGLSADQISWLSARQISWLSADQISWLSADQISGLSADQISGLSADQISGLSADQISGLSADQISWLSARQISWLSARQISWLSARQISGLSSKSKDFVAASLGKLKVPKLDKPYTRMLAAINAGERKHDQRTFGPDCDPATNLCKTAMCTAGHLVNMAGAEGYDLKERFGFELAATLIHKASRPDVDPQNFGSIPQEWALAYIEARAEEEQLATGRIVP